MLKFWPSPRGDLAVALRKQAAVSDHLHDLSGLDEHALVLLAERQRALDDFALVVVLEQWL